MGCIQSQSVIGGGDVAFTLVTEGGKVYCRMSLEALEDHFGANINDPLQAFNANHGTIGKKASEMWAAAEKRGVKYTSQDRMILSTACF